MKLRPHDLTYNGDWAIGPTIISSFAMVVYSIVFAVMMIDPTVSLAGWMIPALLGWVLPAIGFYLVEASPNTLFLEKDGNYDELWKLQRQMPKELQSQVKIYSTKELLELDDDAVDKLYDKNLSLFKQYKASEAARNKPRIQNELNKLEDLTAGYRSEAETLRELL